MPYRHIPSVAGYAGDDSGGKQFAPAADRNKQALADLLDHVAPKTGNALELASGTGQHVVTYAARLPGLTWQPTEIDAGRRASIDLYVGEAGLKNVATAIELDATGAGWGADHGGNALIVLANLLHLISNDEAQTLITEAAHALAPGGIFVIYGPFMRGGELTSDGDRDFHASLQAQDPETGYKDDFDVMDMLQAAGLEMAHVVEMPANNLVLAARRP